MARVNVYLPDDLADEVNEADLNVSAIAQDALRAALDSGRAERWLDGVLRLAPTGVGSGRVADAVAAVKDEFELG